MNMGCALRTTQLSKRLTVPENLFLPNLSRGEWRELFHQTPARNRYTQFWKEWRAHLIITGLERDGTTFIWAQVDEIAARHPVMQLRPYPNRRRPFTTEDRWGKMLPFRSWWSSLNNIYFPRKSIDSRVVLFLCGLDFMLGKLKKIFGAKKRSRSGWFTRVTKQGSEWMLCKILAALLDGRSQRDGRDKIFNKPAETFWQVHFEISPSVRWKWHEWRGVTKKLLNVLSCVQSFVEGRNTPNDLTSDSIWNMLTSVK